MRTRSGGEDSLARRVEARWRNQGWTDPGARVLVAVSGGMDSTVLLHLVRFGLPNLKLIPVAAHLDHAMRADSGRDAAWIRGLTAAWRVPLRCERVAAPPQSEEEARRLRYGFLERIMEEEHAACIVTGHHRDDQVETVLFRILRGTGVRGLAGMPQERPPGILRPLLDEPREILHRYGAARGLRARRDPSNRDVRRSRNRLRHEVLPELEAVHPGARMALARLGRNARRQAEALDLLLEPVVQDVVRRREPGRIVIDRPGLLTCPPAVRRAVVRVLIREIGAAVGETGTGDALEFIRTGSSGRGLDLPGGVRLSREFDRIRLARSDADETEGAASCNAGDRSPFVLSRPDHGGQARLRLGGRDFQLRWGDRPPAEAALQKQGHEALRVAAFDAERLAFPLTVRRWCPGDRTRSGAGRRKLKKVFGERRVPRRMRTKIPVVEDGRGEVIWVPGWYRAPVARPGADTRTWYLGIWDADEDP